MAENNQAPGESLLSKPELSREGREGHEGGDGI
jgi:hypothetical protein